MNGAKVAKARSKRVPAVALFVLVAATCACGDNRGGEVPAIRVSLEGITGVHVIDVVGWDEMWPIFGPIDIRARLQVGDQGVLVLRGLRGADGGTFWIDQIGPYAPRVSMVNDQSGRELFINGCYECPKLARGSAFLELLPFAMGTTPADVIANYARLRALIATWPDQPTRIQSSDGRGRVQYWKNTIRE